MLARRPSGSPTPRRPSARAPRSPRRRPWPRRSRAIEHGVDLEVRGDRPLRGLGRRPAAAHVRRRRLVRADHVQRRAGELRKLDRPAQRDVRGLGAVGADHDGLEHARTVAPVASGEQVVEIRRVAYETILYDVRDDGVATVTLNTPDNRNALSNQLLSELTAAFESARDDERGALRRADLVAREGVLGRRGARPVRRRRPARAQALRHRALPAPVPRDPRARQADDLRGQRARARRRARRRALLRPDRGQGQRDVRHPGDQRRASSRS